MRKFSFTGFVLSMNTTTAIMYASSQVQAMKEVNPTQACRGIPEKFKYHTSTTPISLFVTWVKENTFQQQVLEQSHKISEYPSTKLQLN